MYDVWNCSIFYIVYYRFWFKSRVGRNLELSKSSDFDAFATTNHSRFYPFRIRPIPDFVLLRRAWISQNIGFSGFQLIIEILAVRNYNPIRIWFFQDLDPFGVLAFLYFKSMKNSAFRDFDAFWILALWDYST